MQLFRTLIFAASLLVALQPALADDATFTLTIKDHQFSPSTLEIPAGKKVQLLVQNQDATPEEFESDALRREKVIPGGKQAVISIGPLRPGSYPFKGEFNPTTAQGTVVVR
ncbi:MAG: cupredoxin domain-containing protein [Rhodoferax sp.]